MFSKLCLNLRLTSPMPKHVVLLHKIELGCVWPHIKFVCSVTDQGMCANGKPCAAEYRVLLHIPVAVREELPPMSSRYSQPTLPGHQAVLPSTYRSYLPSFLCFSIDSLRLQSIYILTFSHGTDRAADFIHMGLMRYGVGMADSTSVFGKMIVWSCCSCWQHRIQF